MFDPVFRRGHSRMATYLAIVMIVLAATLGSALSIDAATTTVAATPTAVATTPKKTPGGEVTAELPPPDLPTTNPQGYTFDLKSSLKANLGSVPKEAAVYQLLREGPTQKSAQLVTDKLKIGATIQDRGDGTFQASGDGKVFITADLIQYFSAATSTDGDLPNDDEAIVAARDWLRTSGLLPPDLGSAAIVSRSDAGKRLTISFVPAEPLGVLSAYPGITITLGPKSQVIEAAVRWATIVRSDVYQLMETKQAWQIVQSGQAYIEADLSRAKIDPGSDIKGGATFSKVSIAYATSGPPGGKQFLQPVYVFEGKLRVDKVDGSFPIKAYVPGLSNSGAPVGLSVDPGASS